MSDKIHIEGKKISIHTVNGEDYISLTDMIKGRPDAGYIIRNWMRGRPTLEALKYWEEQNNPDFNYVGYDSFTEDLGLNTFSPSVGNWIKETGAIGLTTKAGRYGGTFAHSDIAFHFGTWVSPSFYMALIQDYRRLKSIEYQTHKLEWSETRFLSKINAGILSEAVKENHEHKFKKKSVPYASAFDMINLAVFGMTAKEWREKHTESKGNIRDSASTLELILISNLESLNATYIDAGASYEARLIRLIDVAEKQRKILSQDKRLNDQKRFIE